jgi:hypothetical protein
VIIADDGEIELEDSGDEAEADEGLFDIVREEFDILEDDLPDEPCEIWLCAWFYATKVSAVLATAIPGTETIVLYGGAEQLVAARPKQMYLYFLVRQPGGEQVKHTYYLPVGEKRGEVVMQRHEFLLGTRETCEELLAFEVERLPEIAEKMR